MELLLLEKQSTDQRALYNGQNSSRTDTVPILDTRI